MRSERWNEITTNIRSKITDDVELLTEKQWEKRHKVPVSSSAGNVLITSPLYKRKYRYYFADEVRDMTDEELQELSKRNMKKKKEAEYRKFKEVYLDELKIQNETLKLDCIYLINKLTHFNTHNATGKNKLPVVIDVETTGLEDTDELLQVSVIDINGKVLVNSYVKPIYHTIWPQAQEINNINWQTVKGAPEIHDIAAEIVAAIKDAPEIIGYNISFDIEVLERFGINVFSDKKITDVMDQFSELYGEWDDYYGSFKRQKLTTCAAYYKFDWKNVKAHDSLADCQATLYCYKKMNGGV